jgi:hypothetical protein
MGSGLPVEPEPDASQRLTGNRPQDRGGVVGP